MTDLEEIIEKVRSRVYFKYITHTDRDDLMQEAAIYVWKKYEEDPTREVGSLIYGSLMKVQSFVWNKSGDAPTGKPINPSRHRQQANGDATREKLSKYIREYTRLHGTKPTENRTAMDLGMSRSNVRFHKKRLHLFDNTVDKDSVKVHSLDAGLDAADSGQDPPAWVFNLPPVVVDYDLHATRSEVRRAISRLPERDREFLYMEFWEDMTYVDIAKSMKVGGAYVNKYRKQVMTRLQEELVN